MSAREDFTNNSLNSTNRDCICPSSGRSSYSDYTPNSPIHILSWTAKNMGANSSDEVWFGRHGSPSLDHCYTEGYLPSDMQCVYTNDKTRLMQSDVLLFRGRRLEDFPLPSHRLPEQKWVFWEFEPPYKVWMYTNLTQYNGLFNLTATYTRDSDIPNMHDLNRMCVRNHNKHWSLRDVNYARRKRKSPVAAWMVSVCHTQSKRERYVKGLKRYLPVDIYGECGALKCGSNKQTTWKVDDCDHKLFHGNNSYKFHLAFENSLCEDYVTEKLWRTQNVDSVPIVMGNVDYAKIMPKDSFIDVRDFHSSKHLAQYLMYLDKHEWAYNQYIRNKNSLVCSLLHKYMPWECILCHRLHQLRSTRKVVYDLAHFWGSHRCLSQDDFMKCGRKQNFDFD